jgi:hypothetical protein
MFLEDKKELIGIQFWREVLAITREWEDKQSTKIHKGTPYFFLAENYLLTGDRDLAFMYLYNAISDDRMLAQFAPSLGYPDNSPAYFVRQFGLGLRIQLKPRHTSPSPKKIYAAVSRSDCLLL